MYGIYNIKQKEFLKLFKNNETNIDILDQILNSHLKSVN